MADDASNPLTAAVFSPSARILWGAVPANGSSPLLCSLFPSRGGAELIMKQYAEKVKNKKRMIKYGIVKYRLVRMDEQ